MQPPDMTIAEERCGCTWTDSDNVNLQYQRIRNG